MQRAWWITNGMHACWRHHVACAVSTRTVRYMLICGHASWTASWAHSCKHHTSPAALVNAAIVQSTSPLLDSLLHCCTITLQWHTHWYWLVLTTIFFLMQQMGCMCNGSVHQYYRHTNTNHSHSSQQSLQGQTLLKHILYTLFIDYCNH